MWNILFGLKHYTVWQTLFNIPCAIYSRQPVTAYHMQRRIKPCSSCVCCYSGAVAEGEP